MSKKVQFQKMPNTLKISLFILSLISSFFILFSLYAYNNLNATSWNFGGMGMYTNIDYPGNRWLTIQQKNNQNGGIIHIDSSVVRSLFFKEYESYLSLPIQENANKLVKKITHQNHTSIIQVWTFKYNPNNQSVKKILKATHEVKNESPNQSI